jgi:hypothetical protein
MVEQYLFVALTLGAIFAIEWLFRKGMPQVCASAALAFGVWYLGPSIFGRQWFHEGFIAGMIFGGFFFHTLSERGDNHA